SRWDEYVSDEVGRDEFFEMFKSYRTAFVEDGNLGIGAFGTEPPFEVFLGSHKEIVVFAPERKPVVDILKRHGLRACELDPYYRHDHQHVALTGYRGLRGAQFDYLHVADVVRHALGMELQEDEENVDEDGRPLGLVAWHAVVVLTARPRRGVRRRGNHTFVQEFGLTARSRREARELLEGRASEDGLVLRTVEELFRIDIEALPAHVQPAREVLQQSGIWWAGDKSD